VIFSRYLIFNHLPVPFEADTEDSRPQSLMTPLLALRHLDLWPVMHRHSSAHWLGLSCIHPSCVRTEYGKAEPYIYCSKTIGPLAEMRSRLP